ncbi:unnamed protein product, partial [Boreogadus saida]
MNPAIPNTARPAQHNPTPNNSPYNFDPTTTNTHRAAEIYTIFSEHENAHEGCKLKVETVPLYEPHHSTERQEKRHQNTTKGGSIGILQPTHRQTLTTGHFQRRLKRSRNASGRRSEKAEFWLRGVCLLTQAHTSLLSPLSLRIGHIRVREEVSLVDGLSNVLMLVLVDGMLRVLDDVKAADDPTRIPLEDSMGLIEVFG